MSDRNDEIRVPIEKALHTPDKIHHPPFLHGADGDNRVRPKIAHFEHEGSAVNPAHDPTCDRGKDVWRRRNDDVGPRNEGRRKTRRHDEAQIVEYSQDGTTIRKHQRRYAQDVHRFVHLTLVERLPIAAEHLAIRVIRKIGQHRDLMTPLDPTLCVRAAADGRCTRLGGIVIADEKYAQIRPRTGFRRPSVAPPYSSMRGPVAKFAGQSSGHNALRSARIATLRWLTHESAVRPATRSTNPARPGERYRPGGAAESDRRSRGFRRP